MRFRLVHDGSYRRAGVMPLAVMSFALLLCVIALVVDGGTLMEDRRHVQSAADAAALAAAADLFYNYITNQGADLGGTARSSALDTAAANGFNNDGVTSVVTVSIFPQNYQSGPNAGKPLPPGYVEVIVQHNASRLFSGVFGTAAIPVCARAVARGRWGPGNDALMLLNLQASGALTTSGSADLSINGGLAINSGSSQALNLSGGAVSASQFNLNQASGALSGSALSLLSGLGGVAPHHQSGCALARPAPLLARS